MIEQILWLIGIVLFLVVEAVTYQYVSIWFAAGCLAGLITSLLGGSIMLQLWIAIGVAAITLILSRPLVKKLNHAHVATNSDMLIGTIAEVIIDIDNTDGTGQVKVSGNIWSAKTADGKKIKTGEQVKILGISGAKLIVEKTEVMAER